METLGNHSIRFLDVVFLGIKTDQIKCQTYNKSTCAALHLRINSFAFFFFVCFFIFYFCKIRLVKCLLDRDLQQVEYFHTDLSSFKDNLMKNLCFEWLIDKEVEGY